MIQFMAYIFYNDISKVSCVLWNEAAYENLLKDAVKKFQIPSNEASEKILGDLGGTPHTKHSFEEDVCRSISYGKVPQFRVITDVTISDNTVTSSTNQSEIKEDVDQEDPEETDISTTVRNPFASLNRIEDNFNMADNTLGLYEAEIVSNNQGESQLAESTHYSNEPEVDIDGLQREKAKLDFFERALLLLAEEFESRLKKRNTLNQRDIELSKLRQRLNRRDEKLSNRDVKITCKESEVALQHYPLNKLEELLYGLACHMNTTRKQLEEHEIDLHIREAMLDEEKKKIKGCRKFFKSKGRRCKMEVDANLDEKEDETQFDEGASTSHQNRSRELSKRVSMKLETKVSKQKRRRSPSLGISDEQLAEQRRPNTPLQAILRDFNETSTSDDQPMKFNNRLKIKH